MPRIDARVKNIINNSDFVSVSKGDVHNMCDISFSLNNRRLNGFSIYMDAVSSARTDRINGKRYIASRVKSLDKKGLYILVVPDDSSFSGYKNPERETNIIKNLITSFETDSNDSIDLILRESEVSSWISAINGYKGNDVHKRKTFQRLSRKAI